jgi:hypothetical protein
MAINFFSPASIARAATNYEQDQAAQERALRRWIANQPYQGMTAAEKQGQANTEWGRQPGNLTAIEEATRRINEINALAQRRSAEAQALTARQGPIESAQRQANIEWGRQPGNLTAAELESGRVDRLRSALSAAPHLFPAMDEQQQQGLLAQLQPLLRGEPTGQPQLPLQPSEAFNTDLARRTALESAGNLAIGAPAGKVPARPATLEEAIRQRDAYADELFNQYETQNAPLVSEPGAKYGRGIFDLAQSRAFPFGAGTAMAPLKARLEAATKRKRKQVYRAPAGASLINILGRSLPQLPQGGFPGGSVPLGF